MLNRQTVKNVEKQHAFGFSNRQGKIVPDGLKTRFYQ
jgi:hypothetical protein